MQTANQNSNTTEQGVSYPRILSLLSSSWQPWYLCLLSYQQFWQ